MAIDRNKALNVIFCIWLLLSLFLTEVYKVDVGLRSLFLSLFLLGIFMSPVWILYAYRYLIDDKEISPKIYYPVLTVYFVWFLAQIEAGDEEASFCILIVMLSFMIIEYLIYTAPKRPKIIKYAITALHWLMDNWKTCLKLVIPIIILISINNYLDQREAKRKHALFIANLLDKNVFFFTDVLKDEASVNITNNLRLWLPTDKKTAEVIIALPNRHSELACDQIINFACPEEATKCQKEINTLQSESGWKSRAIPVIPVGTACRKNMLRAEKELLMTGDIDFKKLEQEIKADNQKE